MRRLNSCKAICKLASYRQQLLQEAQICHICWEREAIRRLKIVQTGVQYAGEAVSCLEAGDTNAALNVTKVGGGYIQHFRKLHLREAIRTAQPADGAPEV